MDNTFNADERLYRAVYPPSHPRMFWKKDGSLSPTALWDPKGLSVERGNYRPSEDVVEKMKQAFTGCIVSVSAGDCDEVEALVRYKPTKNIYHSEIHGSETEIGLKKEQLVHLARKIKKEYMEE